MKHVLLIFLLLSGKLALSQEKLIFFKNFPSVPCTPLDTNFRSDYYKCLDNKTRLIGVAYSDSTVFIPPKYKDVTLISFSNSCMDNGAYFLAENPQGEYDLFHPNGSNEIKLPELHSIEPLQTLSHLYRSQTPPFLYGTRYTRGQNVHVVLDAKTGKTTNDYLHIEAFGNTFIGYRETGIDLVDTNLNITASIPLQEEFEIKILDSKRFEFNDEWAYSYDFCHRDYYDEAFVNRLFNVAVITRYDYPTKREAKKGLGETATKQLIHLPSGKTSYSNYQEVYRVVSEKEVYYWTLKDTLGQNQVFDVYNEQLECLRSVQITPPEKFHEFHSLSHYYDYERFESYSVPVQVLFFLENPEGKLAAVHHNGTRLTDFIWDRKVTYEGMKKDSTPVFLFCAKDTSLFGILVDKNNIPLFGNEYASLSSLGDQRFYRLHKNTWELKVISADFEVLLDSVKGFYEFDRSVLNLDVPYLLYKTKENRIFIFTGREVSPLVPSFFKSPATRNRISKPGTPNVLFVDKEGYLISD